MDAFKAAGPHGIYPATVKPSAEYLANHFAQLLNASLDERQVPAGWLTLTVTVA